MIILVITNYIFISSCPSLVAKITANPKKRVIIHFESQIVSENFCRLFGMVSTKTNSISFTIV